MLRVPQPGQDDVLIRVGACGMNNTDINTRIGWYSPNITVGTTKDAGQSGLSNIQQCAATWDRSTMSFPRIQGADIAGTIVHVGANVASDLVGTRVLVDPWLRDWRDPHRLDAMGFVGSECHGGYAEYASVPARNAHPVHTALTDAELATFPCSYVTAENMLARVQLGAGESVLITGASGGVGSRWYNWPGAEAPVSWPSPGSKRLSKFVVSAPISSSPVRSAISLKPYPSQ